MSEDGVLQVLKKDLFSVFLAADDRDESEISFGESGTWREEHATVGIRELPCCFPTLKRAGLDVGDGFLWMLRVRMSVAGCQEA